MDNKTTRKNIKWDARELRRLYWEEKLTTSQIAVIYNRTRSNICSAMKRLDVERRDRSGRKAGMRGCSWKGGRYIDSSGYIQIRLYPDDFFYPLADKRGYVREHRLIVAKALGRNLHPWEIVHHKHTKYPAGSIEDKQDNRYPENLQLVTDDRHKQISILERKIATLEERLSKYEKV